MITFDPTARRGRQYTINGRPRQAAYMAFNALVRQGHSTIEAREILAKVKASVNAVDQFIAQHCHNVPGSMMLFREFIEGFHASLPTHERFRWTRYRVSRALRAKHPSGTHTNNKVFVANLAWLPSEPSFPILVVRNGSRRRLVKC